MAVVGVGLSVGWTWEGCGGGYGVKRSRGGEKEGGKEEGRGEMEGERMGGGEREMGGGAYLDGSGGWASGFEVCG